MTIRITKKSSRSGIVGNIEELSGVNLSTCYQCKKCSSGCPVGDLAGSPPSEIIRRLHLGADEELLESDIVWMCMSCETCSARCPMGIDIAAVMDALRALALKKGTPAPEGNVPLFNRALLTTVKLFGRTYDMGMIAAYKLGAHKFLQDTGKFPEMLKKKKIALILPRGSDKKTVRRIFRKTQVKRDSKP
ncbi:MAG: 4Fe-4S dicluster domain-containing protein [Candidatus Latescibacteria bacterium]|nr:4Fe-4S dicluster domain-containing protein [Candidatus Latescibacterota bacterium]